MGRRRDAILARVRRVVLAARRDGLPVYLALGLRRQRRPLIVVAGDHRLSAPGPDVEAFLRACGIRPRLSFTFVPGQPATVTLTGAPQAGPASNADVAAMLRACGWTGEWGR